MIELKKGSQDPLKANASTLFERVLFRFFQFHTVLNLHLIRSRMFSKMIICVFLFWTSVLILSHELTVAPSRNRGHILFYTVQRVMNFFNLGSIRSFDPFVVLFFLGLAISVVILVHYLYLLYCELTKQLKEEHETSLPKNLSSFFWLFLTPKLELNLNVFKCSVLPSSIRKEAFPYDQSYEELFAREPEYCYSIFSILSGIDIFVTLLMALVSILFIYRLNLRSKDYMAHLNSDFEFMLFLQNISLIIIKFLILFEDFSSQIQLIYLALIWIFPIFQIYYIFTKCPYSSTDLLSMFVCFYFSWAYLNVLLLAEYALSSGGQQGGEFLSAAFFLGVPLVSKVGLNFWNSIMRNNLLRTQVATTGFLNFKLSEGIRIREQILSDKNCEVVFSRLLIYGLAENIRKKAKGAQIAVEESSNPGPEAKINRANQLTADLITLTDATIRDSEKILSHDPCFHLLKSLYLLSVKRQMSAAYNLLYKFQESSKDRNVLFLYKLFQIRYIFKEKYLHKYQSAMEKNVGVDNTPEKLDMESYLQYEVLRDEMFEEIKYVGQKLLDFWTELSKPQPNCRAYFKIGNEVYLKQRKVDSIYKKLFEVVAKRSLKQTDYMLFYGAFKYYLTYDMFLGNKLISKIQGNIKDRNGEEHKKDEIARDELLTSRNVVTIRVGASEKHLNEILAISGNASEVFGLKKERMVKTQLDAILPRCFASEHKKLILKNLTENNEASLGNFVGFYARHNKELSKGLNFLASLKKLSLEPNCHHLLCDRSGMIDSMSKEFFGYMKLLFKEKQTELKKASLGNFSLDIDFVFKLMNVNVTDEATMSAAKELGAKRMVRVKVKIDHGFEAIQKLIQTNMEQLERILDRSLNPHLNFDLKNFTSKDFHELKHQISEKGLNLIFAFPVPQNSQATLKSTKTMKTFFSKTIDNKSSQTMKSYQTSNSFSDYKKEAVIMRTRVFDQKTASGEEKNIIRVVVLSLMDKNEIASAFRNSQGFKISGAAEGEKQLKASGESNDQADNFNDNSSMEVIEDKDSDLLMKIGNPLVPQKLSDKPRGSKIKKIKSPNVINEENSDDSEDKAKKKELGKYLRIEPTDNIYSENPESMEKSIELNENKQFLTKNEAQRTNDFTHSRGNSQNIGGLIQKKTVQKTDSGSSKMNSDGAIDEQAAAVGGLGSKKREGNKNFAVKIANQLREDFIGLQKTNRQMEESSVRKSSSKASFLKRIKYVYEFIENNKSIKIMTYFVAAFLVFFLFLLGFFLCYYFINAPLLEKVSGFIKLIPHSQERIVIDMELNRLSLLIKFHMKGIRNETEANLLEHLTLVREFSNSILSNEKELENEMVDSSYMDIFEKQEKAAFTVLTFPDQKTEELDFFNYIKTISLHGSTIGVNSKSLDSEDMNRLDYLIENTMNTEIVLMRTIKDDIHSMFEEQLTLSKDVIIYLFVVEIIYLIFSFAVTVYLIKAYIAHKTDLVGLLITIDDSAIRSTIQRLRRFQSIMKESNGEDEGVAGDRFEVLSETAKRIEIGDDLEKMQGPKFRKKKTLDFTLFHTSMIVSYGIPLLVIGPFLIFFTIVFFSTESAFDGKGLLVSRIEMINERFYLSESAFAGIIKKTNQGSTYKLFGKPINDEISNSLAALLSQTEVWSHFKGLDGNTDSFFITLNRVDLCHFFKVEQAGCVNEAYRSFFDKGYLNMESAIVKILSNLFYEYDYLTGDIDEKATKFWQYEELNNLVQIWHAVNDIYFSIFDVLHSSFKVHLELEKKTLDNNLLVFIFLCFFFLWMIFRMPYRNSVANLLKLQRLLLLIPFEHLSKNKVILNYLVRISNSEATSWLRFQ